MTARQLKNSILQMAVQGKLVSQDPNDEPACILLKRIREEKEKLIKAGKIKREKNPSEIFRGADNLPYEKVGKETRCIADEIPFEIPDSWEWVRCGEVFQHNTGKALNASNRSGQLLRYITTSNLYWNRFELEKLKEMFFTDAEIDKCTARKGDLLVCEGGDFGRAAIWDFDSSILIQNHIHRLRSYEKICTRFFYYLFFFYKSPGLIGGKGIGIQGLSSNALHALLFPLPPLAEQKRIVAKIEELLPHLEDYDRAETQVLKLNAEFPELLKKSILQWAIQGKLVPQDPADEPASVLLERIRAEKAKLVKAGKIKKDKNESVIFRRDNSHYEKLNGVERCIDDEIPFDIPENWTWVRLRNIFNVVSARRVHQADWRSSGIPFYRAREIALLAEHGYVNNELFIDEKLFLTFAKDGIPSAGDLMITAVGTLGKSYIVKDKDHFYYKDASVICFENFAKISPEYIQNLLNSPYMIDTIKSASTGTTVGTITMVKANEYLIPLPPLAEQQRIVEAIEPVLKKLTI